MFFFHSQHVRHHILGALACFGLGAASVMAQETLRAPTVTVVAATEVGMIDQVPISGTLVAREEVQIYPQVSGYTIDAMLVDIGDKVSVGEVLARLNGRQLEAQMAQAQAELARALAGVVQAESQINSAQASLRQAQSVLDRAEQLRTSGTGSQASLDQAITNQETANANVASVTSGLAVAAAQLQQAQAQADIAS